MWSPPAQLQITHAVFAIFHSPSARESSATSLGETLSVVQDLFNAVAFHPAHDLAELQEFYFAVPKTSRVVLEYLGM
jgi:hypothetical protein